MKVLVACEYSGIVRDAFIAKGHDAVSCDLLPTELPGPHYQQSVTRLLKYEWDMVIAFPPCTKLSKVGAAYWRKWQEDGSQQEAIDFFLMFTVLSAPKVVIENPAGIMSRLYRKPDQYVQPWMFGHPWVKATGLWLKGVPKLQPSDEIKPRGHWVDGGTYRGSGRSGRMEGAYGGAPLKSNRDRAKERSRTFTGIAKAMAEQWG